MCTFTTEDLLCSECVRYRPSHQQGQVHPLPLRAYALGSIAGRRCVSGPQAAASDEENYEEIPGEEDDYYDYSGTALQLRCKQTLFRQLSKILHVHLSYCEKSIHCSVWKKNIASLLSMKLNDSCMSVAFAPRCDVMTLVCICLQTRKRLTFSTSIKSKASTSRTSCKGNVQHDVW